MSQVHKDLQLAACAFCYKHYRLQQLSHPAIHDERRTGTDLNTLRLPGVGSNALTKTGQDQPET